LNGDGETTVAEALTTMRFALGVEDVLSLTPAQLAALDMSGDGSLAAMDALEVLNRALGLG
jgi:hypothetical protein